MTETSPNDTMDDVDNAPRSDAEAAKRSAAHASLARPAFRRVHAWQQWLSGDIEMVPKSAELSQIHDGQARTAGEVAQLHSNGQQTPTTHLSYPKRISMVQVGLNNDTNSNVKRTGEIVARVSEPPAKDGRVKIVKTVQAESLGFPTGAELQAP